MKRIRFCVLVALIAALSTLTTTSLSAEQIGYAEEDQIVIPDFYKEEGQVNLDKLIITILGTNSLLILNGIHKQECLYQQVSR